MFVAQYRQTMAGAKLRLEVRDDGVVSSIELRRQRRAEASERERQAKAELIEIFRARKEAADEAIRRANEALRRINGSDSFERIFLRMCRVFRMSPTEMLADRRNVRTVFARQAVMYWARRRTCLSLPQIGRRMTGRDHTTILHGCRAYVAKRAEMGRNLKPFDVSIQHGRERP